MTGTVAVLVFALVASAAHARIEPPTGAWVEAQAATPLQIPQEGSSAPDPGAGPETPSPPEGEAAPNSSADDPAPSGPEDSLSPEDEGASPDELSLGEIPVIETIELTSDLAKKALDSYLLAKEKYSDSELDQYENLQDFVDQAQEGKAFEADIKAFGFANVSDWNLAITTLGLIYGSVVDDQTADLEQQIAEVQADTELAQDIKDRMIKALKAMIPSENNKRVVNELLADPTYAQKLGQLDIEEE